MSRTILEITADIMALDDLLEEVEGNVSDPRVAEIVEKWFAELDHDFTAKLDNYAALITELSSRAEFRAFESDRLHRRAKTDEATVDWLKFRLRSALDSRGDKKVQTPRYTISIQANGGKLPVEIYDAASIPKELCRHIPESWEPSADKVRDALIAKTDVPGAVLGERGTHLRIR